MIFDSSTATELANWSPLGASGLAGVVLYFYRQDRMASEAAIAKLAESSEKRIAGLADDFREVIQQNTAASVALKTYLEERKP